MTKTGLKIPGEYTDVSRQLFMRNVGHLATAAHAMPVTADEAQDIIRRFCGRIEVKQRGYRGRARVYGLRSRITIPAKAGIRPDGVPYLRLGVVLHECAHILARKAYGRGIRPHGEEFCIEFAKLLKAF